MKGVSHGPMQFSVVELQILLWSICIVITWMWWWFIVLSFVFPNVHRNKSSNVAEHNIEWLWIDDQTDGQNQNLGFSNGQMVQVKH